MITPFYTYGTFPFVLLRAGAQPGTQKDTATGTECYRAGGHSHSHSHSHSSSHSQNHNHGHSNSQTNSCTDVVL